MSDQVSQSALIEVIKPVGVALGRLADGLLVQPGKAAGELIESQFKWWTLNNVARKVRRAKELRKELDLDELELPLSFLMPWARSAADVDDPDLEEMWARLLANACDDETVRHPLIIETLRRLRPSDGRLLQRLVREHPLGLHWLPLRDDVPSNTELFSASATLKALELISGRYTHCGDKTETPASEISLRKKRCREYGYHPPLAENEFITDQVSPFGWDFLRAIGFQRQ